MTGDPAMELTISSILSTITTDRLVKELESREGVTKYPKWSTREDIFKHRQTIPGNKILLEVVVD